MILIVEQGTVSNGGIVLSKPLLLPEGTKVRIQVETIDANDSTTTEPADAEDFASLSCFGMWADREEIHDSVTWLKKEREKWQQRHLPQSRIASARCPYCSNGSGV